MALLFECTAKYAPILLDTADIVRDAMLRQAKVSLVVTRCGEIRLPNELIKETQ